MYSNVEVLNELLNRACEIITSLEGYAKEHSHYPDHNKELQKAIDDFFNEVDTLNEVETAREKFPANIEGSAEFNSANQEAQDYDVVKLVKATPYEQYVANVKRSIDKATEEGILKNDCSEGYSYLSKEEFIKRDPDMEAQDYNTFGNNKI